MPQGTAWLTASADGTLPEERVTVNWTFDQAGQIADIRDYCETDVVNTYLVFLRFQLMRGVLTREQHEREVELVRSTLADIDAPHWRQFLEAWGRHE